MAYKYETKNCKHCEYCVKTGKGLYCSHREGRPKVTSGGWCIDRKERQSKMDDDLRYYGNPMNWESVKRLDDAPTLPTGRWVDDKCSICEKGIEDLIDSREWYRNETPNYCPFCGVRIEEADNERS